MYKYKCTECGQLYDELQEYCDCGNDSFDVIEQEENQQPYTVQNQYNHTPTYSQYSNQNRRFDLPSVAFLVVCLILSFVILFFVGNPSSDSDKQKNAQTQKEKQQQAENKKAAQNIPSIDELWIENPKKAAAPVSVQKEEPAQQQPSQTQTVQNNIQKTISDLFKPAQQPAKTSVSTQPVKTYTPAKTTPAAKKVSTKTTTKTTKTVSKPAATTVKKQQPQKAPTTQTSASKTTSKGSKKTTMSTISPKVNAAAQKRELLNYKIALRNKIASNINFAAVVGDGSCAITFKISQSGKLTNRAFSKQSTNDSLNDAVYNAVMQTPAYNPPPSGYKNETLKLSVTMYGGNFEVDLN